MLIIRWTIIILSLLSLNACEVSVSASSDTSIDTEEETESTAIIIISNQTEESIWYVAFNSTTINNNNSNLLENTIIETGSDYNFVISTCNHHYNLEVILNSGTVVIENNYYIACNENYTWLINL